MFDSAHVHAGERVSERARLALVCQVEINVTRRSVLLEARECSSLREILADDPSQTDVICQVIQKMERLPHEWGISDVRFSSETLQPRPQTHEFNMSASHSWLFHPLICLHLPFNEVRRHRRGDTSSRRPRRDTSPKWRCTFDLLSAGEAHADTWIKMDGHLETMMLMLML
ncbi:uncharacterized protein V6R79_013226 [Siganus canaliculatus]